MPAFVIIVLSIYLILHAYLFLHLRPVLPAGRRARLTAGLVLFLLFATLFLAGAGRSFLSPETAGWLWQIGAWWFGFVVYAFLLMLLVDLARLLVWAGRGVFAPAGKARLPSIPRAAIPAGLLGVVILLFAGHLNARHLRVNGRELELGPSCGPREDLSLVLISDLHLGVLVGRDFLREVVAATEALQPDLIVFAGDIVDRDTRILEREKIGELLSRLRAPLGVYAVTGNHEYITGIEESVDYLTRQGIVFLRDRAVKIDDSFYLAGRDDIFARRRGGRDTPLAQILRGIDDSCPIILLDHQPRRIGEAVAAGVDLILCGHTHHGQLFPVNLITSALYPVSWGWGRIEETQIYVTGGAGTWGPRARIGNIPEIVHLRIKFQKPRIRQ